MSQSGVGLASVDYILITGSDRRLEAIGYRNLVLDEDTIAGVLGVGRVGHVVGLDILDLEGRKREADERGRHRVVGVERLVLEQLGAVGEHMLLARHLDELGATAQGLEVGEVEAADLDRGVGCSREDRPDVDIDVVVELALVVLVVELNFGGIGHGAL